MQRTSVFGFGQKQDGIPAVCEAEMPADKGPEAINGTKRKARKTVWRVEEGRAGETPTRRGKNA